MKAKVSWKDNLIFAGVADSGFDITLGAGPGAGGQEDGMRPMELIAVGLAGCTAMDVISILQKKRQQVTDFHVEMHADRASEHPRVFTHIVLEYNVTGHKVDEAAVLRSIELSATKYCPAYAMLAPVVPIELKYHVYESGVNGDRELVASGEYEVGSRQ
jgi:putative redox protein